MSRGRKRVRRLRALFRRRGSRSPQRSGSQAAAQDVAPACVRLESDADVVPDTGTSARERARRLREVESALHGRRPRRPLTLPRTALAAESEPEAASDQPEPDDASIEPELRPVAPERTSRLQPRGPTLRRRRSERPVVLRAALPSEPAVAHQTSGSDAGPVAFARRQPRHVALTRDQTDRVPTDVVEPRESGAPWWRYRRPILSRRDDDASAPTSVSSSISGHDRASDLPAAPTATEPSEAAGAGGLEKAATRDRSGLVPGVLAAMCLAVVVATGRMEVAPVGRVLIPAAAILAAIAFGHVLARRHPDEPWLPKLLVVAVVVKVVASIIRFYAFIWEYGTHGDASVYDVWGTKFFHAWTSGVSAPDPTLSASSGTAWVRWFTGVVYYVFGPNMLNGFLVFGLLALIGTYLLGFELSTRSISVTEACFRYRPLATTPTVAIITVEASEQRGRCSFSFDGYFKQLNPAWQATLGYSASELAARPFLEFVHPDDRDATMAAAARLAEIDVLVAFENRYRCRDGSYKWLLWNVRPHLLAFVTFAAGAAYVIGRAGHGRRKAESTSLVRPLGIVVVVLLVFVAMNQAAEFLGMKDFSISSVEQSLNDQTARTAQGGSKVGTGKTSLTPMTLPQGAVKVLMRPFPWEVETKLQILASLESAALAVFLLYRIRSVAFSLSRARTYPFFIFCWTFVLLYAVAFSAIANFGLLTRQRSLALPALFVLLAVEPARARPGNTEDRSNPPPPPAVSAAE